jgi:hypothetical protein
LSLGQTRSHIFPPEMNRLIPDGRYLIPWACGKHYILCGFPNSVMRKRAISTGPLWFLYAEIGFWRVPTQKREECNNVKRSLRH